MSEANISMPDGPVENPGLWKGDDLQKSGDYVIDMSRRMIDEIKDALHKSKKAGLVAPQFNKADFQLPRCETELCRIRDELETGKGFVLYRGFPLQDFSDEEAEVIFWGLMSHLGTAVSQNSYGHILGHVRNLDLDINQTNVRGYQTTVQLAYHNDQSDVIGLLCIRPAKSGGQSSLVSAIAVHNEMMRERPDLLEELYKPFYIDRRGELGREDEGNDPYYAMPVFSYHKGLVSTRYIRGYIMSGQRFEDVPRLTAKQIEALDMFDAIAQQDGMALDFFMEPGDIQLANNYCVLHSRTSFEDHGELEKRRHLLRVWLCMPNSRELPPCFKNRFGSCESGAIRGFIPPRRKAEDAPAEEFALARL